MTNDEADEFDLLLQDIDVVPLTIHGKDELDVFINAEPTSIDGSALDWWLSDHA